MNDKYKHDSVCQHYVLRYQKILLTIKVSEKLGNDILNLRE